MENYLGGSSKALQFVIDAVKHARDKCFAGCAWPGGAEQIPTNFFIASCFQSFVMETRQQNYGKFGDSNLVAFRNISLQRSLSELERSSSGGDITMKGYP
jgi:hypothetical protein